MNETDFQNALQNLLNAAASINGESDGGDLEAEAEPFEGCRVVGYEEAGVLTRNAGLVVRMADGSEFQVTIVQSQAGRDEDDELVDRTDRCENCGNRSKDELIWIENGVDGEVECGGCGHHYHITHA